MGKSNSSREQGHHLSMKMQKDTKEEGGNVHSWIEQNLCCTLPSSLRLGTMMTLETSQSTAHKTVERETHCGWNNLWYHSAWGSSVFVNTFLDQTFSPFSHWLPTCPIQTEFLCYTSQAYYFPSYAIPGYVSNPWLCESCANDLCTFPSKVPHN